MDLPFLFFISPTAPPPPSSFVGTLLAADALPACPRRRGGPAPSEPSPRRPPATVHTSRDASRRKKTTTTTTERRLPLQHAPRSPTMWLGAPGCPTILTAPPPPIFHTAHVPRCRDAAISRDEAKHRLPPPQSLRRGSVGRQHTAINHRHQPSSNHHMFPSSAIACRPQRLDWPGVGPAQRVGGAPARLPPPPFAPHTHHTPWRRSPFYLLRPPPPRAAHNGRAFVRVHAGQRSRRLAT